MPVDFDDYAEADEVGAWLRPDSNSHAIVSFLADHPGQGFTPTEIHEEVDIPMGSVGPTLQRLEERDLVRHRGSYWAIARDDRLAGLASTLATLNALDEGDDWDDVDWDDEAAPAAEMAAWREARRDARSEENAT